MSAEKSNLKWIGKQTENYVPEICLKDSHAHNGDKKKEKDFIYFALFCTCHLDIRVVHFLYVLEAQIPSYSKLYSTLDIDSILLICAWQHKRDNIEY